MTIHFYSSNPMPGSHSFRGFTFINPSTSLTYASVVSRECVRIVLLIAALNDLEILGGCIGNAYLNADTNEKVWYMSGIEWGEELQGRVAIITKASYGVKSSTKYGDNTFAIHWTTSSNSSLLSQTMMCG